MPHERDGRQHGLLASGDRLDTEVAGKSGKAEGRVLQSVGGTTIFGQVLWLSGPVLVEQLLVYIVGLSDTILTARYLSVEHLAAVTTASYVAWFLSGLLMVVSAGSAALVARKIGAGKREEARKVSNQAQFMALVMGSMVALLATIGGEPFARLLNLRGYAAEQAGVYLGIVLGAAPLIAARAVGVACLRGAGDTRTGMWVMVLVNLLNISFSWSLVVGVGPFPEMGLRGIAIGTLIGEAAGGLVILFLLIRGRSGLQLRLAELVPRMNLIARILRISVPAAGESLVNATCQLWFLGLINRLGSAATAAHGVALRCEALAFLTLMSFSIAGGTLAGQYLGARRKDLADRAARTAWATSVTASCLLGFVLYFQAESMMSLFMRDANPDVSSQGISVLRLVAFALPALATIQVFSGVLRGVGETRSPMLVALIGYLGFRIPMTYLLTGLVPSLSAGYGLYGAWIAMFVDLVARAVLISLPFLRGKWKEIEI